MCSQRVHVKSSAVPQASSVDDPRPAPPVQPDLEDCCHSGCSPCVFDLYDEALERYRIALTEWEARQAQRAAAAA
ncbi:oxidoreductase-like domain-containing protein, partial [Paraburkholderia kirstenboschensis]|uniref:oxidoreductase-like domain-containing protein n=1 Tax=Paraburkholderia kirstenboschensis TaxID=1245436 RepID=UPI00311E53C0